MKRKTLLLIICFALAACLSACGNDKFATEDDDSDEKIIAESEEPSDAEESVRNESEEKPVMEEEVIDLNKEIVFSDEYLEKKAKEKTSSLTVGGLQEITDLDLYYDEITVPEELSYFSNLQSLEMNARENGNISWLSYFPNLEYLKLDYNHIDNIEEIGNCDGLVCLRIDSYNITDISFLEKLKTLEELDIYSDTLQDFSPVNDLTNLRVLEVSSNTAESLNIDFSNLTNLQIIFIQGPEFSDVTALNSLNIYAEPTFSAECYLDENYKGIFSGSFIGNRTEKYRDNYSNDKRPETECFKFIYIYSNTPLTNESAETIARINYKYLQTLDFHIDKYYNLTDVVFWEINSADIYQKTWDNLVSANGDPLLKNDAVTVATLPDLENFDNPQIYLDGRYIGLYCPLEDMVSGYMIDGSDALNYINSVYASAHQTKRITLCSESGKTIFHVTIENTDESIAKPISECEVIDIDIYRNTNIELRLPQGNETNEYVSWNYRYQNFTDIYENCYHDENYNWYYIFCNDKCDIIEMAIDNNVIDSISLYRRTAEK